MRNLYEYFRTRPNMRGVGMINLSMRMPCVGHSRRTPAILLTALLLLVARPCHAAEAADELSSKRFRDAETILRQAIEDRAFPGCAFAVGTSTSVLWKGGLGKFTYEDNVAAELSLGGNPTPSESTIYDLASLTKVVGTTSVVALLVEEKKLRLDEPVSRWIPGFAAGEDSQRKGRVTVEHLLLHASGLPSWRPFYREADGYKGVIERAIATPLEADPGTRYVYSDIGFILLGEIASQAGGSSLAELEEQLVFKPLGMTSTTRTLAGSQHRFVAPTEYETETKRYVHGVVHDENSRVANGQTGHAGLFSNAVDLSRLATDYLQAFEATGQVFSQRLAQQFSRQRELIPSSNRAFGWGKPTRRGSGGQQISPDSFGHTGFTGTSIWMDPKRGLYFILLTNRVHPTRENRLIGRVRREFADAVLVAFDQT